MDNRTYVSFADIEARAHQLRAEAARDMGKSIAAWFRARFATKATVNGKLA
ncbi:RSP_7527 family protein [Celeribacter sp.]|uniref:RSP_7527 family protein n=1 Tax=Celeribacter sp. TaxID=1890673 RepID=UPI003A924DC7